MKCVEKLKDEITWNVQGIPIKTYVGSIREVDWRRVQTNFMVVFPLGVLEKAPQLVIRAFFCTQFLIAPSIMPVEDDVTIYSGATILGGDTVIGARSVIGGNVWITESLPPDTQVLIESPRLIYRKKGGAS